MYLLQYYYDTTNPNILCTTNIVYNYNILTTNMMVYYYYYCYSVYCTTVTVYYFHIGNIFHFFVSYVMMSTIYIIFTYYGTPLTQKY